LWWPVGVLAHAHLVASDPVDGGRLDDTDTSVELRFSEGIEVAFSRFMLHGDDDGTAPAVISPISYGLGNARGRRRGRSLIQRRRFTHLSSACRLGMLLVQTQVNRLDLRWRNPMTRRFPLFPSVVALTLAISLPVAADWRQTHTDLTIGIPPIENAEEGQRRYGPFADYLSETLGVPVTLRMASAYSGIIQAMDVGEADMAMLGAAAYAAAHDVLRGDLQPLGHAVSRTGDRGYFAVIIVAADSPAQSLEDLAGKTLAFADPNSASGYLVPNFYLGQMGLGDGHFASTGFSGSHDNGILAVVRSTYDAAATWHYTEDNGAVQRMTDRGEIPANAVRVVWESPLIPSDAWSVRASMPEDLKADLLSALTRFHDADPERFAIVSAGGSWTQIVPVGHEAFVDSIAMREAMLRQRN
jgi:phosphonate transport system substrate-binding protein